VHVRQALRRELDELERLVAGYQRENEKLTDQLRQVTQCLLLSFAIL
jgi:uncharacterized coiled-coil protein SlyX